MLNKVTRSIKILAVYLIIIAIMLPLLILLFTTIPQEVAQSQVSGNESSYPISTITPARDNSYPPPNTPVLKPSPTAPIFIPSATPLATTESELLSGAVIVYGQLQEKGLTIWLASAQDPSQRKIILTTEFHVAGYNAVISPDQRFIAMTTLPYQGARLDEASLWLIDISKKSITLLAEKVDSGRYLNYPVWSQDSKYITFSRRSGLTPPFEQFILVIDLVEKKEQVIAQSKISTSVDEGSESLIPLGWPIKGSYLYYQKGVFLNVELWRYDARSGNRERVGSIQKEGIPRCYFISPDGSNLLCLLDDELTTHTLTLISTITGQAEVIRNHIEGDNFADPLWSPDGDKIIIGMTDNVTGKAMSLMIDVTSRSSQPVNLPSQSEQFVVSWSPDGSWIASRDSSNSNKYFLNNLDKSISTELLLNSSVTIIGWITEGLD
jgi:Tol biopolymer transport system component